MKAHWTMLTLMGLVSLGAVVITVSAGDADEEKVSIDQVPPAVKATILKEAEGGTIKEIERETKDGKTTYEAEVIIQGKEVEIKVAPNGTLIQKETEKEEEEEQTVSVEQVPAVARQALARLAGEAKIIKFERERKHGIDTYEGEWKVDGHEHGASVTAEGALVETEEGTDAKDVPEAVKKTAAKLFPAGAKVSYEKHMVVMYEVEAKILGIEREVTIYPTGKVARKR